MNRYGLTVGVGLGGITVGVNVTGGSVAVGDGTLDPKVTLIAS